MRVLILANYAQGLVSFRRELLEALCASHEVWACAPEPPSDPYAEKIREAGAAYVRTPHLDRRGTSPLGDLLLLSFYLSLIREVRPDVVLTYTIKPNVYGGMACQRLGVPYVANVTGLGTSIQDGGPLQRLTLSLYRRGLKGASMVFFQNASNRDFMVGRGLVSGPCDVLPGSGVSTERFGLSAYPDGAGRVTFLTVGRIMRDKGVAELVGAACEVAPRHPEARFVLLGDYDEDWAGVVSHAEAAGVLEHVPFQSDVRPYYASCHALVHPSWHEGMSNVCLEAAATGRPVIASDVPGCRETFDEGVSGLGFEPRDAGSLVGALERFLAMPWEERRAMGLAGREKVVREFDRRIVVERYMDAIGEATGGAGS